MKQKNLIAVGVDQNGLVWNGHYGVSPQYYLFNSEGKQVEKRSNPHAVDEEGKQHHGKPELIAALLPECSVFIGRKMGHSDKLMALGVKAITTEECEPKVSVLTYINNGHG